MPDYNLGEVLCFDKPLEWTSFDVVKKVKNILKDYTGNKRIKVGHAGTLDPLASGLLIICTGRKTKIIESIQTQAKEYTGIIQLGSTTASYDLETEPENHHSIEHLKKEAILDAAKKMVGEQEQLPPIFSAKKINGKRAYDLARAGKKPEMKTKLISIYTFDIEDMADGEIFFRITCSKGTYIRSIAHDFGQALGVGGYLKKLERTKIGSYELKNAFQIEGFKSFVSTLEPAASLS